MRNLVIIGASGFAREMYDLAIACYGTENDFKIKGFLSDGDSNIESMGYPKVLNTVSGYKVEANDVFFCAIGKIVDRKKTVEIILSKGGAFINLIHPSAVISPSVRIGVGVGIKSFCVIASDVIVEDFTFLQSSVIIGHDVHIGGFCQVNSFSFFAGYVRVHDFVTVNAGVRVIQNIIIEEESVVGIGSVVLNRVRKGTTVFGNPAKKMFF
jgi:sugar O-acyltransferase (sialic acid O-acetyltransferase NeuD family)